MTRQSASYAQARTHFARCLKELMDQHSWRPADLMTQTTELAAQGRVPCGVHAASIYQYLEGKSMPSRDRASAIATALGVELEDMLPYGFEIPEGRVSRAVAAQPAATIEIKRVGGLKLAQIKVNIRATLPAKRAVLLSQYIKELLRKADIKVVDV
jgi:hypothetical protein